MACFFACTVLVSEGLVAEDTIICLWECGTQIIKSGVYVCGMTALFLAALRAFGDALQAMQKSEACFAACRYDGSVLSGVSVVYIRYALPLVAALPLWFAACCAHGRMNAGKEKTGYVS